MLPSVLPQQRIKIRKERLEKSKEEGQVAQQKCYTSSEKQKSSLMSNYFLAKELFQKEVN